MSQRSSRKYWQEAEFRKRSPNANLLAAIKILPQSGRECAHWMITAVILNFSRVASSRDARGSRCCGCATKSHLGHNEGERLQSAKCGDELAQRICQIDGRQCELAGECEAPIRSKRGAKKRQRAFSSAVECIKLLFVCSLQTSFGLCSRCSSEANMEHTRLKPRYMPSTLRSRYANKFSSQDCSQSVLMQQQIAREIRRRHMLIGSTFFGSKLATFCI